jgi:hypothetical protein
VVPPLSSASVGMTSRGGSARSPLKPKSGLNGPPKVLVAGASAESFFSQLATGKPTAPNEQIAWKGFGSSVPSLCPDDNCRVPHTPGFPVRFSIQRSVCGFHLRSLRPSCCFSASKSDGRSRKLGGRSSKRKVAKFQFNDSDLSVPLCTVGRAAMELGRFQKTFSTRRTSLFPSVMFSAPTSW